MTSEFWKFEYFGEGELDGDRVRMPEGRFADNKRSTPVR